MCVRPGRMTLTSRFELSRTVTWGGIWAATWRTPATLNLSPPAEAGTGRASRVPQDESSPPADAPAEVEAGPDDPVVAWPGEQAATEMAAASPAAGTRYLIIRSSGTILTGFVLARPGSAQSGLAGAPLAMTR